MLILRVIRSATGERYNMVLKNILLALAAFASCNLAFSASTSHLHCTGEMTNERAEVIPHKYVFLSVSAAAVRVSGLSHFVDSSKGESETLTIVKATDYAIYSRHEQRLIDAYLHRYTGEFQMMMFKEKGSALMTHTFFGTCSRTTKIF